MTVSTTTSRITYSGDGVSTVFAVPFIFFGSGEIQVVEKVTATGVETTKTLTTDYSVTGGSGETGSVTAVSAPASGVTWTIARNTNKTQLVDYVPNDPFPAATHERALDRLTCLVQELADAVARAAKLSVASVLSSLTLPDPSADTYLGWKSDLSGLENKTLPTGTAVYSSIANTRTGSAAAEAVTPDGLASLWQKGADIASAATLAKPADANLGGYHVVTGSVGISAFWTGDPVGTEYEFRFSGGPVITHSANFILPLGANVTAVAGDVIRLRVEQSSPAIVRVVTAPPTWFPPASVTRKPLPRRQTVINGPVTSAGLPNFGGSTGSTTVTASGTIVAAAANGSDSSGQIDRVGSKVNPSWTGLSTNGTMYLYVDVNADGTLTEGVTTVAPVYQPGGTPATTSGQFTFNIQEMVGYVGNGSTAPQTYRVFVGEVTVSGGVVTAITWYAVMGRYIGAFTSTLPTTATAISQNHNIGTGQILGAPQLLLKNLTTEQNFAVGDIAQYPTQNTSGGEFGIVQMWRTAKAIGFTTGTTSAWRLNNKTTGAGAALTLANWAYAMTLDRGW